MGYDLESTITIAVLTGLIVVYLYLLLSPNQPKIPPPKNVVIRRDTLDNFRSFMNELNDYKSGYNFEGYTDDPAFNSSSKYKKKYKEDDFFLDPSEIVDGYKDKYNSEEESEFEQDDEVLKPIVPSNKVICKKSWIVIRSDLNYKYLWMHGNEHMWMGASATIDTPLHRKAFILHPLDEKDCISNGGWVLLQEGDSDHFIRMVNPNRTDSFIHDSWVIRLGTNDMQTAIEDHSYHFLLEEAGYIVNRESMACVNVLTEQDYPVRGHSSGWNRDLPAHREFGAMMHFQLVNNTEIIQSIEKEKAENVLDKEIDDLYIQQIQAFTNPKHEKRVISFGLYGSNPKYTTGAIRNVELVGIYFPGWVCRFYVTADVPKEVIDKLKALHAEIESIPSGMGYTSGMFWRFMIAADPSVDRFIVRDSDSRLNARDRIAVEEWIQSKYPIHILRDHVNHCIVMNGGMWGGIKGILPDMESKIKEWENRNEYMADLHFLDKQIWPYIKNKQYAHDTFCCDRFPNTHPFPTKRYLNYQHVGQVFNEDEEPRLTDIDGWIRGVPIPSSCRKQSDWIYG